MENFNQENSSFVNRPSNEPGMQPPQRTYIPPNTFAKSSMVLGILALIFLFTCTVYPAMVLGSLSIILALLSKGREKKMHANARTGVILATVALTANLFLICGSFYLIFSDSAYREQFNQTYESIYGKSFDEMIEGIKNGTIDYDDIY